MSLEVGLQKLLAPQVNILEKGRASASQKVIFKEQDSFLWAWILGRSVMKKVLYTGKNHNTSLEIVKRQKKFLNSSSVLNINLKSKEIPSF